MARFDINTRVSRVFLRGYAFALPAFFLAFAFFSLRPSVFFTPEKPVTSFQSDDGKIMDTISIRHRDYLSQLFTVPADVVLYRCLLNHTSFFFSRFVSLKLISATINHNKTRDESRINEISRHRILFVLVSLSLSSQFSLPLNNSLSNFRIESIYRPTDATNSALLLFFFFCLNNLTIFNSREEKK